MKKFPLGHVNNPVRPGKESGFPVLLRDYKSSHWYGQVALGNGTQFAIALMFVEGRLIVGIEGYGCYGFAIQVGDTYVAEKLRIMLGDAMNVADLINTQINGKPLSKRQGRYSG